MKVLVTGSLGLIGSNVIPGLAARYDLKLSDIHEGEVGGRLVESLDITDYESVLRASRGVDAILHLAIASERTFVTDRDRFHAGDGEEYLRFNEVSIDTNVRGTYHIYEAARQNKVASVIYGSSLTVFMGAPAYENVHDNLPPRPSNFYGVTKLWGETLGEYFARRHGLRVCCLRLGTPHPHPQLAQFPQWLDGPVSHRTFVTFCDIENSMIAALEAKSPVFGAYMIVSASRTSIFDVSGAAEIGWQPSDFIREDVSIVPVDLAATR